MLCICNLYSQRLHQTEQKARQGKGLSKNEKEVMPEHRGKHPMQGAILHSETELGTTKGP